MLGVAVLLTVLRPWLPAGLVRIPEAWLLPWRDWIDVAFEFIRGDREEGRFGLIYITRALSGGLEFILDAVANVLYGKHRWPRIEQLPWPVITGCMAVLGYALGCWRLALLAGGTFLWAALIGQWDLTMETMSVIAVAAPFAFTIGGLLGIWSWKSKRVEETIKPLLLVMQVLPFFSYLLPAVIFFKVGPTAATVATIAYALPPMILMTTLGLKKVSPEVIEAGKMSGCSSWQMLRHVYIPSARTEIMVGLNQVIMLCLAMVVLTAAIGMPGLGAKLLAMMGSFKLGRSLEIGITIVLLAVTLDRLSKAWVVKQPEHFEKGTPWWRRNIYLVVGIASFVGLYLLSWVSQGLSNVNFEDLTWSNAHQYAGGVLDEVKRKQSMTQGRALDGQIKQFLAFDWVQSTTYAIRYFFNNFILIPSEKALLFVPTPAVILAVTALALGLGGFWPGLLALVFFCIVAEFGYWDRAMLTLHSVFMATFFAFLFGAPLAVWAARHEARARRLILLCDTFQTFPSYVYLLPAVMLFGISPVTVIISILIYTMVPVMRYTVEGLRGVPAEMVEAAEMSGATRSQKLWKVQIPLAMPTIAVGLNQALVFAFFMVIIAEFIGTRDLGQEMRKTLAGTHLGWNFVLGFSVVFMALTFDIAINAWAERRRKILGLA
ncbi:L-proline glycine betaine ABC transport system permease protein ProW [Candidatus Rhodobacter oscarellae]|uniref:L-proline glycine betaine ABC transport system permease protein ProW n=2 Tax=Candidatus Rhodobacter oscarellae TaxID=1675527 RepID=A0A0J9E4R5_9RHOB|nr:ABC transporter permease subunit [Candidatus Rhodobacter lobularis]KMW57785.1 L-proline glycine betaine ABC transport system permease protein ProW [Candidatus Rhodobacter lobularis]